MPLNHSIATIRRKGLLPKLSGTATDVLDGSGAWTSIRALAGRKVVTAVSLNSAATDVATFTGLPSKYRVLRFMVYEASTSLAASAATIGLYTASGGGGTAIIGLSMLTVLSGATKWIELPAGLTRALSGDYYTAGTLYVRNGTAHGSAATVSVLLEIMDLS